MTIPPVFPKPTQYDQIADQYEDGLAVERLRRCALIPTAIAKVGDLRGKQVLDLACGAGLFSRLFKQMGAAKVVGIDISPEMIARAKKKDPEGSYVVSDVCDLSQQALFDLVFAGFCLHYAKDIPSLEKMCEVIATHLKSGEKFVSFAENPAKPTHTGIRYHFGATASEEIRDGVKITRTHYDEQMQEAVSFTHFHYEPTTYFEALSKAGFTDIQWSPFLVEDPPSSDWNAIANGDFSIAVLTCTKK